MTPRDRLRIERGAVHLHALGARSIAEFLLEIGKEQGCIDDILDRVDLWRWRLTPAMVRAAGADHFAPRPLRQIPPCK
jgi:hypothetical protein